MLNDFPKFLTDDISVSELKKLKEKERIMHEHSQKTKEIAEAKRLKHEVQTFMDQIHQSRLNGKILYDRLRDCLITFMKN